MYERITHALAVMVLAVMALAACGIAALASAHAAATTAGQLHARAVSSFQQGRYAEAYGRFMALADAGHAPSAEVALFMYSNGLTLFGSNWDVTPDQLAAWAQLVDRPAPVMMAAPAHPAPLTRSH